MKFDIAARYLYLEISECEIDAFTTEYYVTNVIFFMDCVIVRFYKKDAKDYSRWFDATLVRKLQKDKIIARISKNTPLVGLYKFNRRQWKKI